MDEIEYRQLSQPERLQHHDLVAEDLIWLGRNPRAVVGTDADQNAWPTQLDLFYDVENDQTIVMPRGPNNKILPYKLTGLIEARDVKTHFRAEFYEPEVARVNADNEAPIEHDPEEPIVSTAAQVSGSDTKAE